MESSSGIPTLHAVCSVFMSQASPVPAVLITPPQQRPTRRSKRGRAGGDELEPMARGLDPATDVQEQLSKTQCRILEAETSSNSGDPPAQPEGAPAIHSTSISATEASRSPLQGAGAEAVEAEVPRKWSLDRALQPWSSELMHTRLEDMFLGGDFETRGRQLSRPTPTQFSTLPDLTFEAVATAHSARDETSTHNHHSTLTNTPLPPDLLVVDSPPLL